MSLEESEISSESDRKARLIQDSLDRSATDEEWTGFLDQEASLDYAVKADDEIESYGHGEEAVTHFYEIAKKEYGRDLTFRETNTLLKEMNSHFSPYKTIDRVEWQV